MAGRVHDRGRFDGGSTEVEQATAAGGPNGRGVAQSLSKNGVRLFQIF